MAEKQCNHEAHKLPGPLTAAGRTFFRAFEADYQFFHFIIDLALRADYVKHIAEEALDERKPAKRLTKISPSELAEQNPGPATKFLRKQRLALLQMYHCRVVDNFTTYLADIIREALAARPEMLRSGEQIRLDYALSFGSIQDLREDLIDRKVGDLGYLGFASLCDWIRDHMGLKLVEDDDTMAAIIEILETRNVIVHNRGVVGEKYLRTVSTPKFKEGEVRRIEVDDYASCCHMIAGCVKKIDAAMAAKYGLPTAVYREAETHHECT